MTDAGEIHPAQMLFFGQFPAYLIEGRPLLDQILTLVTAYVAYHLYLAYAEGIVRKSRLGAQRLGLRGVLDDLIEVTPFVPSVLVAALISLSVTIVATGLLLIPGVWLYTRWSLATPVIREESVTKWRPSSIWIALKRGVDRRKARNSSSLMRTPPTTSTTSPSRIGVKANDPTPCVGEARKSWRESIHVRSR